MTLILGINLTDSVYLAADTRVTRKKGNHIIDTHDNLYKLWANADGLFCAVAGDAGLAQFLLRELRYQPFSRRGIDVVRENIENFVLATADEYWREKGVTTDATLMFAGKSHHKRAYIETDLIRRLVYKHLNNKEAQNEFNNKFFTYREIALTSKVENYRTNLNNTELFAVRISSNGVQIIESSPGQHLVYGSVGLVKEDIQLKDIARIEFSNDDKNGPMLMTAYINWMRDSRNLQGVSSTVIPLHILPDGGSILTTGDTHSVQFKNKQPVIDTVSSITVDIDNNQICRVENGRKIPLTPIEVYDCNTDAMTYLSI